MIYAYSFYFLFQHVVRVPVLGMYVQVQLPDFRDTRLAQLVKMFLPNSCSKFNPVVTKYLVTWRRAVDDSTSSLQIRTLLLRSRNPLRV